MSFIFLIYFFFKWLKIIQCTNLTIWSGFLRSSAQYLFFFLFFSQKWEFLTEKRHSHSFLEKTEKKFRADFVRVGRETQTRHFFSFGLNVFFKFNFKSNCTAIYLADEGCTMSNSWYMYSVKKVLIHRFKVFQFHEKLAQ